MAIVKSCVSPIAGMTMSCTIAGASDGIAIASRDDGVKAIAAATIAAST